MKVNIVTKQIVSYFEISYNRIKWKKNSRRKQYLFLIHSSIFLKRQIVSLNQSFFLFEVKTCSIKDVNDTFVFSNCNS